MVKYTGYKIHHFNLLEACESVAFGTFTKLIRYDLQVPHGNLVPTKHSLLLLLSPQRWPGPPFCSLALWI